MKTVTVISEDRVGLLSDISYILGKSRIAIEGVTVDACAGKAVIALTVRNPEKAKQVLTESGYEATNSNTLFVKQPACDGLDAIKRIFSKQRISIRQIATISSDVASCIFSLNVDKPRKAVKLLGEFVINRPA